MIIQEKEIFDLVADVINSGLSADEMKERISTRIDKETLKALWSVPRKNINVFIKDCLAGLALKPPFLDLGCGRRSLRPEILQKYGDKTTFIGIDHFLPPREGNDLGRFPNVIAQAEAIPLGNSSVGTVFCMELLEHVPDVYSVLGEISRVTCPNSYLVLSLPGLDIPKHERLPFQRDYRRIPPKQLENILRDNSFSDIEVKTKVLGGLHINIFATARR